MRSIFFIAGLICVLPFAQAKTTQVSLSWNYENFPLKIKTFNIRADKAAFISETASVNSFKKTPATSEVTKAVMVDTKGSTPLVLVVTNDTDKDLYFFAVPHELNPHHASAGHYFECLCVGRVFHIPPKKTWYRIVRINLNESFQGLKSFDINHKIVGIDKKDAETKHKEQIYD